jgi:hypothetical protein
MTGNSLHMQWPLTSQLHGIVSQREQLVFLLWIKLHANESTFQVEISDVGRRQALDEVFLDAASCRHQAVHLKVRDKTFAMHHHFPKIKSQIFKDFSTFINLVLSTFHNTMEPPRSAKE